jgi:5-deoxy-glucuronate isomerase
VGLTLASRRWIGETAPGAGVRRDSADVSAVSDSYPRLAPGERVTPERAGWRYLSFAVHDVVEPITAGGESIETAVIILAGGGARVGELELPGRASVWAGLPSAAYLPPGPSATVTPLGQSVTVAVANSPASGRETARASVLIGPEDVRVEIRGAGNATRQINHIITPDFPADRLEIVEVYTPSGNWSSWPPHKHDTDDMPREAILEEVYHYRFRRREAWGVQRLYGGSVEGLWPVRDGETVIVRDGYHPFVATHGDDAYYLNALAGDVRTMACSFDPALDHVRSEWSSMDPDPRVPLVR